jgi:hypothetical protein
MDDTVEEIKAEPSSIEEKEKEFKEHTYLEKWVFVPELISALQNKKFKPTDWVMANDIGNLVIMREIDDGSIMIAVINFHRSTIEFYL